MLLATLAIMERMPHVLASTEGLLKTYVQRMFMIFVNLVLHFALSFNMRCGSYWRVNIWEIISMQSFLWFTFLVLRRVTIVFKVNHLSLSNLLVGILLPVAIPVSKSSIFRLFIEIMNGERLVSINRLYRSVEIVLKQRLNCLYKHGCFEYLLLSKCY